MITIRMHCGIARTVEAFIESMRVAGYTLHKWSPSYDEPLSVLQFDLPPGDNLPRFSEAYIWQA